MKASLKNSKTGELRQVKVGFSWVLFLLSGVFGLPLFLRRLYALGGLFLVLWVINFLGPMMVHPDDGVMIQIVMGVIFLLLQIWLGIKGNEMTAKNYLENGWEFAEPTSDVTRVAKGKWGLA